MDLAALRRWWPLAAVLALLFGTALAAIRSSPQLDQIAQDAEPTKAPLLPTGSNATQGAKQPPEAAQGLPDWIGTVALLVLGGVAILVLAALLDVYRQARYATHTVDDQMRQQAVSALQRLRADLGAGVQAGAFR